MKSTVRETSNPDQGGVLIVSEDADFSRAVTGRWQSERNLPAFTLVGPELCGSGLAENYHAAIVGGVQPGRLPALINALHRWDKPVLLVCERTVSQVINDAHSRAVVVQQCDGWLDTVVLLISEMLRRREALGRVRRLEQESSVLQRDAILGRYVLEMRHTLNNALTAVLGNAELLLLEPGSLAAGPRSQVETVRNMALRIHEIMQRFSSLEKELSVVEREAEKDSQAMAQTAGANY